MKTGVVLYGALLAATAVLAQEDAWKHRSIGLEQVKPFLEPEAKTVAEKAAVKFKPQIHISAGCSSYPAVNAAGETTDGLMIDGPVGGKCKEPEHGSQVYGRSTWHREKWAIMYAWHFVTYTGSNSRYDWEHVVLWLDNPAVATPTLEAVSIWTESERRYRKAATPESKFVEGSSVKLDLGMHFSHRNLSLSPLAGELQPLIMWDQMPNNSRSALNSVKWYGLVMPLSQSRFTLALENAWPFAPVAPPPRVSDDEDI